VAKLQQGTLSNALKLFGDQIATANPAGMAFVFGNHARMKELERRIPFIARARLPVLIEGASGTGKSALAELLHQLNGANTNLIRILCRQLGPLVYPLAREVTGAANLREVCRTTRGTVLVKNVQLLTPREQQHLLVALEAGDLRNGKGTGGGAWLVSTATESLEPRVERGEFNPALYYRLSVYRICLPALRERSEDIPELFVELTRHAADGTSLPPLPTRLLDALMAYDWPGNVRELENIARTYVARAHPEEIIIELKNHSHKTSLAPLTSWHHQSLKEQVKGACQRLETEIILRTLEQHRWNRRRAAETLQISYRSLLYKMKSCNLRSQPQTDRREGETYDAKQT
jgi:DNA-binding NtrC family response regulator